MTVFQALLLCCAMAFGSSERSDPDRILLATTTSTVDTGLLDHLLPRFQARTGIAVKPIAVGTGEALAMGRRGDADVLLVHNPKAEDAFMAQGFGALRLEVMANDFLLIGPPRDPAQAKGHRPLEALQRIAEARAPFVSRGDDSGTHQKEAELWETLGITPQGAWYLVTGQGMAESARVADQKQAYLLIDRSTYRTLQDTLSLVPIAEGTSELANPYGVIVVNPTQRSSIRFEKAQRFAAWLVSEEAQALIGAFGKDHSGTPLFTPLARRSDRNTTLIPESARSVHRDDLLNILGRTLFVSGVAIVLAMILGVPMGIGLALGRFPGRGLLITLVNTGMGLPPVVVGLFVFLLLARSGPLGHWDLLYTPTAMILAQVVIALPLVVGVTLAGIQGLDPRLPLQILSLGASRFQLGWKLVLEARLSFVAALAAGFGSILSEVGAVLMVGGNLPGETQVMTTAIVLATRQGRFTLALTLSMVLLLVAVAINALFTHVQQRQR